MTVDQIHLAVKKHKPCSRRNVFRFIATLKIKPLGHRQRPQQYPEDTPAKILSHLGLAKTPWLLPPTAAEIIGAPTMRELRAARSKAKKGGRK